MVVAVVFNVDIKAAVVSVDCCLPSTAQAFAESSGKLTGSIVGVCVFVYVYVDVYVSNGKARVFVGLQKIRKFASLRLAQKFRCVCLCAFECEKRSLFSNFLLPSQMCAFVCKL